MSATFPNGQTRGNKSCTSYLSALSRRKVLEHASCVASYPDGDMDELKIVSRYIATPACEQQMKRVSLSISMERR